MTDKHYGNRLLVVPYGGESNLTVVFREHQTGNVLNGSNGDCDASVTFAQGRIAATRHPESGDWLIQLPATDVKTLYGTLYYRALAEVDKETTPDEPKASAFLFDANSGVSFSDLLPILNGRVLVE